MAGPAGMPEDDHTDLFDDEGVTPTLVRPEEPVHLRDGLREALLDGQRWPDGPDDDLCLGQWLWERWGPALEPEGLDRVGFFAALMANRRELWLWLMGERQWAQFIEGQAGRILRRLPGSPKPGTAGVD